MQIQMQMQRWRQNERCKEKKNCQTVVQFNGFCCINAAGNICYAIAIYRAKWRRLLTMRIEYDCKYEYRVLSASTSTSASTSFGCNCAKGVENLWLTKQAAPQAARQQAASIPLKLRLSSSQSGTQPIRQKKADRQL